MFIPGIGNVFLSGAGGVGMVHVPTRAARLYDKKGSKKNVGDIPLPPDADEEDEKRRRRRRSTQGKKTSPMERRQEREDKRRRRAMKQLGPVVIPFAN